MALKRPRQAPQGQQPFKRPRPVAFMGGRQLRPAAVPNLRFQKQTSSAGPEKKNVDVGAPSTLALAFGSAAWTAAPVLLNPIAQGTTANTRLGRKTQNISLLLRWSVQLGAASTGGAPVRVKVVFDKQANGAAPAITDIFTLNDFHSVNNLDNTDRFITLIDFITPTVSLSGDYSVSGVIKKSLKLETMWTGAAGAIANITSGSFYLLVAQEGGILVGNAIFTYLTRIRYIDI